MSYPPPPFLTPSTLNAAGGGSEEAAAPTKPQADRFPSPTAAEQASSKPPGIGNQPGNGVPPKHQDPRGSAFPSAPPQASGAATEKQDPKDFQQPSEPPIAQPAGEAKHNLEEVLPCTHLAGLSTAVQSS